MKNTWLKSLVASSLVAMTLTGCDLLDKADDITFTTDFDLPSPFVVSEGLDNPANPYESLNSSIEASQDPEFEKYRDRIKEITVNSITYTIQDFEAIGPVILTSGQAIFSGAGTSSEVIAQVSNVTLSNGATGELTVSDADVQKIADILLNEGEIMVRTVATISDSPVYFKVNVIINVSITANALD